MTINMSSLEEVTNQLMKPVKELADWEYPLSETLGKYFALLENPGEINYGEAAFVVQNSTEVFTKRVDSLSKEVCVLSENFIQHEAEEEKSKLKNKERRSRKTAINFDNFEMIDFRKEIGKNINLKPSSQKHVKLLNRRFPQLEIATTHLQNPIDIFDVHGEIIGKKYDFRCNQQLTSNGMLVDECMPSDFDEVHASDSTRNSPILRLEISDLSSPDITTQEENETMQEDTGYFSSMDITSNDQSKIENSIIRNDIERSTTLQSIEEIPETIQVHGNETTIESSVSCELIGEISKTREENQNEETTIETSVSCELIGEISKTVEENRNETTIQQTVTSEEITETLQENQNEETTIEVTEEISKTVEKNRNETTIQQTVTSEEITETLQENQNEETTIEVTEEISKNVENNFETNELDCTEDLSNDASHFDDNLMDCEDDTEELQNSQILENNVNPLESSVNNQTETIEIVSNRLKNQKTTSNLNNPLEENTLEKISNSGELNSSSANQNETIVNVNCQSGPSKTTVTSDSIMDNSKNVNDPENSKEPTEGQPIIVDSLPTNQEQEEDESISESCKETDSGYRSGESEDFEIPRRRSERTKNMISVINEVDKTVWKPIPFDQGIPEQQKRSRSKFKLPCDISLLKSKPASRKRKLSTEGTTKRKRSLLGFLMNESPESPLKKLNMYSPSRSFMALKTEELNDFQKSFEDCFKSRQCYDVLQYEAATTITMDLLGFFPTFTKKDPLLNSTGFKTLAPTPEHISTTGSDAGFSPRPHSPEIVIFDTSNSSPSSPHVSESYVAETFETEIFDNEIEDEEQEERGEEEEESPLHSTLNYQQIIESRMKEIQEEFDVRTDLEQNVARWHEMIRPKLEEVERRPPFHIQEYSDRIINKLSENSEHRINFDTLIVDQSPGEAARYFSAVLQLANTYNVDIETSENKTDIQLTLLNNDIIRHEISCETPKSSRSKNKKRKTSTLAEEICSKKKQK